jgi:hypothetical protein
VLSKKRELSLSARLKTRPAFGSEGNQHRQSDDGRRGGARLVSKFRSTDQTSRRAGLWAKTLRRVHQNR